MNQDFDIIIVGGGRRFFTAINIVEKNPKLKVAILERGADVLQKSAFQGRKIMLRTPVLNLMN
jgi:ribulose 1,5-bisphosphate synthetase/thiazole synthase